MNEEKEIYSKVKEFLKVRGELSEKRKRYVELKKLFLRILDSELSNEFETENFLISRKRISKKNVSVVLAKKFLSKETYDSLIVETEMVRITVVDKNNLFPYKK